MPGKVKVRILAGRNLPVMDRSSDTTDAYVEVKLGNTTFKTDVFRKSLNPQWNSEWFIFEVDDLELQDEPLQIRLMDHDTYSANDAIGKVYVDLNPLLLAPAQPLLTRASQDPSNVAGAAVMSGWLPVYDTMHGIRGEVNILVKVDLFSDFNKFRQSSCGVQFFFTPAIPTGFRCNSIIGFVEELVVNDDPEYQWIDKIRTPRASNEARQTLFSKLSGELQRRIGLKVLDQGGNGVIGYRQCFDLEGESGIAVRGIGSVVSLTKITSDTTGIGASNHSPSPLREFGSSDGTTTQRDLADPNAEISSRSGLSPSTVSPKRASRSRKTSGSYSLSRSPQLQEGPGESTGAPPSTTSQSPTNSVKITSPSHASGMFFNRRSSDSDISITPKGGSLTGSGGSSAGKGFVQGVQGPLGSLQKPLMSRESFDNLIYPFLTMKSFPPNFIIHLGGTVSARSVKLLDRSHLPEEMDSRDSWWAELRTEIRSHARSIACNVVLGYEEFTTICDEVCVLNASGTAAVINICPQEMDSFPGMTSKISKDPFSASLERKDADQLPVTKTVSKESQQQQNAVCRSHPNVIEDVGGEGSGGNILTGVMKLPSQLPPSTRPPPAPCTMCHIPYMENANPFNVNILKCSVCRKGKVPDVLLTTLELPATIPVTGRGCLIQARVVRAKKDLKGELNAKEISDSLPFLEYELHKQLYQKIMMKGMNSLFGLRVRVTVGERWVVGIGTGTAVYLTALPAPSMPRVVISGTGIEVEKRRSEMQKKIQDTFDKNKETFGLKFTVESQGDNCRNLSESKSSDTEDSEEELLEIDLSSGNKDAYVLDLDDLEDLEMINLLLEGSTPPHLIAVSTQTPPGLPLEQTVNNLQMFTRVWRGKIPLTLSHSVFSSLFEGLLQSIYFKVRNLSPCIIAGLKVDVELPEEDEVQISVLGMVLGQGQPPFVKSTSCSSQVAAALKRQLRESVDLKKGKVDDSSELMFTMEEVGREGEDKAIPVQPLKAPSFVTHSCNMIANAIHRSTSSSQSFPSVPSVASISSGTSSTRSSFKVRTGERQPIIYHQPLKGDHFGVEITPLSFVPGAKIERYLGNLNFFFIRESTSIKEYGGLSGFMGSFVTEVLALVRAHVAAVGGNAMISYFLSECVLLHNPHKNQAQCLINVGGDIVQVTYCIASQVQEATESTPQQVATNVAESTAGVNSIISE